MNRTCKVCREEIPPARIKILPHTQTCVNCSTDQPYVAVNMTHGQGDHTWNDIQILTQEKYQEFKKLEEMYSGKIIPKSEEDELDFTKSSKLTVDEVKTFEEDNSLENEDEELLNLDIDKEYYMEEDSE